MAELFGVGVPAISKHLANIYAEGELNEISTVSKMEIVQQEGSRDIKRNMEFYNLDAIISVGYRVNSRKATNFRIWATGILKEYMIKGFAMDDERLKQGKTAFGKDYAIEEKQEALVSCIFAGFSEDEKKNFAAYNARLYQNVMSHLK